MAKTQLPTYERALQLGLVASGAAMRMHSHDRDDPFMQAESQEMQEMMSRLPPGAIKAAAANRRSRCKLGRRQARAGFAREESTLQHDLQQAATIVYNICSLEDQEPLVDRPPLAGFGAQASLDLADSGIRFMHGVALTAFDVTSSRAIVGAEIASHVTAPDSSKKRARPISLLHHTSSATSGECEGGDSTADVDDDGGMVLAVAEAVIHDARDDA